jgi:hypothetical protein
MVVNEIDAIIAYENGELDEENTIALFQRLIDSGLAWRLQGHYGRTAAELIRAGICSQEKLA